jgi:hypothetical protein
MMHDEDITFDQVRDLSPLAVLAHCRICGCTDEHACLDDEVGPCWWLEPDLCSHCGEPAIVAAEYDRLVLRVSEDGAIVLRETNLRGFALWTRKARTALGRASTVDPQAFEV